GTLPADITNPGSFIYAVKYSDPTDPSGCFATDSIKIDVKQSPRFTFAGSSSTANCAVPNGFLQLNFFDVTTRTMNYSVSGLNTGFSDVGNSTGYMAGDVQIIPKPPLPATLGPDTYAAFVFDQLSGCSASGTH